MDEAWLGAFATRQTCAASWFAELKSANPLATRLRAICTRGSMSGADTRPWHAASRVASAQRRFSGPGAGCLFLRLVLV